jgi:5'-nucleotidase/2',3'-cyclic-nucleotide 2'-phosphodiesterase/3'-nucleotidase/5'-nucleotidase
MKSFQVVGLFVLAGLAFGQVPTAVDPAQIGSVAAAQNAADALKTAANTDGAFLAAGLMKETFNKEDLSTMLLYPTDEVVVLNLTGAQLKVAFERSISLFPQPNTSFLQISGFEVTFNRNAAPNARVTTVTAGGAKLEDGKTYSVAMPANLGRGGLGYFKIWDKSKITRTLTGVKMEDVLRGKHTADSAPRWVSASS